MFSTFSKKVTSKISIVLFFVFISSSVFFTPLSKHGQVQEAEALIDVPNLVQNTLTAGATAISSFADNSLFTKEYILDGILNALAKSILKNMTQSILTWINSGFQGSPAFVTDLEQFLIDSADEVAGEFIYNDENLNFLCSPFQLDVKIALATNYQQETHGGLDVQCTLSEVSDNIDGFLGGSFADGGWASWFAVTQNPVNTPTGAYLEAQTELTARIVDKEGNAIRNLDWGDGFKPFKVCRESQDGSGESQDCTVTTPGSVISDQINKSLGAGQDSLIAADEIDELIGAFFSQLAQQAITGANGLLGLGASSYSDNSYGDSGSSSFLDALARENTHTGGGSFGNPFEYSLAILEENTVIQNRLINEINILDRDYGQARVEDHACNIDEIPDEILTLRKEAINKVISNTEMIDILESMNQEYTTTESPERQLEIMQVYNKMLTDGTLVGEIDNLKLDLFIDSDLKDMIDEYRRKVAGQIIGCRR